MVRLRKLPSRAELLRRVRPTVDYWLQTEVHVYALAIAASIMLSFFPFLIVMVSFCRYALGWRAGVAAIYAAVDGYFPGELGDFIVYNLRIVVQDRGALQVVSLLLLLFTANGIFVPLEVALNRVWGVSENRSYWRNQALSMVMIFACGSLALAATILSGAGAPLSSSSSGLLAAAATVLLRLAAVPLLPLMLLLIYWRLPNRRIPLKQVAPVAVVVGLALQAMQYLNMLTWPLWRAKVRHEYGPFYYSVSIILWSFLAAMVVLAGAEWAARRERAARASLPEQNAAPHSPAGGTIGSMRVELAFGKTGLTAHLPQGFRYRILEARSATPLADPLAAIETALENPIGRPPLRELARGKRSAAIAVCDITRPAPNRLVLPAVLARLEQAGIARESVRILIATGLHRPADAAEMRLIVGETVAEGWRVENHDARDLAAHRYLGRTASGTPAWIDDRFLAADLHITLGFIEPHLMLGYSGGRKLIVPGLAARETIQVLHSPRFMRDPRAIEGSIEDNPLHRELLEIAALARHDFIVDVALARDRSIAGVFAGDPVAAHRQGVEFVSRVMLELLDEPVDAVLTTGAGYPLDLTFYQAIKGVTAAAHILKPGGRILLVAACEEGAGGPEFRELMKAFPDWRRFMDHILRAPVVIDQWQLEKLALVAERAELLFYVPGLPEQCGASLWGRRLATIETAVQALLGDLPPGAAVAVIPEGPYVLAKLRAG